MGHLRTRTVPRPGNRVSGRRYAVQSLAVLASKRRRSQTRASAGPAISLAAEKKTSFLCYAEASARSSTDRVVMA
jgi:hypothetical protein